MNVAVIGAGRVGLVAGVGLADFGLRVQCIDSDKEKIRILRDGSLPFTEPGLAELIQRNTSAGRLSFSTNLSEAVDECLVLFLAVGTEETSPGHSNLTPLFGVAAQIAKVMKEYRTIVIKSTVPVGTARQVSSEMQKLAGIPFDIVSNPEFLREGSAIDNFMRPDRVILGGTSQQALAIVRDIYRPLYLIETPILITDHETAELIKYASNSFLAVRISFMNEIADLCDAVGADVHVVAKGLGLDKRIGSKFLHPGPGFGGSCLPKDARVLVTTSHQFGCALRTLEAALETNEQVCAGLVERLKGHLGSLHGRKVGVLGLAYKPLTDDVRDSRAVEFVRLLLEQGAAVQAFDPAANHTAAAVLRHELLRFEPSAYQAASGADALAVLTEWNEFRNMDLQELKAGMRGNLLLDARDLFDPATARSQGFVYVGRGRGPKYLEPHAAGNPAAVSHPEKS